MSYKLKFNYVISNNLIICIFKCFGTVLVGEKVNY